MAEYKSLEQKLDENRIIQICGNISESMASRVVLDLLVMSAKDEKADIHLYFASEQGDYVNTLAIYDTMRSIPNEISGTCIGYTGSFPTLLLAACTKGKRYALKHSEFAISQPNGYFSPGPNQQTEVAILEKETSLKRQVYEELLAQLTSQDIARIHEDCEKGRDFTAEEAKEYGLIDVILEKGE